MAEDTISAPVGWLGAADESSYAVDDVFTPVGTVAGAPFFGSITEWYHLDNNGTRASISDQDATNDLAVRRLQQVIQANSWHSEKQEAN